MIYFIELLIQGISLGAVYALIALGFVIIFKATEVINFAHGSLLLLGGYVVAATQEQLGFGVALLLGLTASAVGAVIIERFLIRPLRGRDHNSLAILTIGVDVILLSEITRRIGPRVLAIGDPWGSALVTLGPFTIPQTRLAAIVVGGLVIGVFFLAFKYSSWGIAMRAAAEDGETAALMGIKLGRVTLVAWLVAGLLAALAAVFLVAYPTPGLTNVTGLTALVAFPAAILGGLDSTAGALVGGIAVGVSATLASGYDSTLSPFLGSGFGSIMPFVLMIAVLLWRPSGLFGTQEATRV